MFYSIVWGLGVSLLLYVIIQLVFIDSTDDKIRILIISVILLSLIVAAPLVKGYVFGEGLELKAFAFSGFLLLAALLIGLSISFIPVIIIRVFSITDIGTDKAIESVIVILLGITILPALTIINFVVYFN